MSQKTNYLKSLVLIAGLLFMACQSDDSKELSDSQISDIPILRKEFKEFKNLPGLLSEVLQKQQSFAARGTNTSQVNNFVIDSTSVTEITNNGIVYYTLAVSREATEEGTFENLVVFDNDGEKKAVLIKYKPDASFLSRRETNPDAQFSGKINMTELNPEVVFSRRSTTATKCFVSTHKYCTNGAPGTLAGPGCYLNRDKGAHVEKVTVINCFEVVVNNPEPYLDFSYVKPDVVNDGGGGNPEAALPIATQPVFLGLIEIKFIMRLNPAQKVWWNSGNNNAAVASILNFLKQNTYDGTINRDALKIARDMIDASIAYGYDFTFDNTIQSNNSIPVNSVADLIESYNNQPEISSTELGELPSQSNSFFGSYKFKMNLLSGVQVNVKFSVSRNYYHKALKVTSQMYGVTLGDWTQSDSDITVLDNGNIKIIAIGTIKYPYTIEGLGVKLNRSAKLTLILNPLDATIISATWHYID